MTLQYLMGAFLVLFPLLSILIAESVSRGLRVRPRRIKDRYIHNAAIALFVLLMANSLTFRHFKKTESIPYSAQPSFKEGSCLSYSTLIDNYVFKVHDVTNRNWTVRLKSGDGTISEVSSFDLFKETLRKKVKRIPCP